MLETIPVSAAARRETTGLPFLIAAGLLWGTGGITGRLLAAAPGLPALAVAAYRLAIGGLLLVALVGRRRPRGRAAWRRVGLIAVLSALYQSCYFLAVSATSVSLATLITLGASPVLVTLAETLTGRRRLEVTTAVTLALALCGLGLLVGRPPAGLTFAHVAVGAALAMGSAAGFAVVSLVNTRPVAGLGEATLTGYGFTGGALILQPFSCGGLGFHPGPKSLALLGFLGVGPTALAYTAYLRGLRATSAGTATVIAMLEPLTGTVLATLVLGERLGVGGICGAVALGAAVLIAARDSRARDSRG